MVVHSRITRQLSRALFGRVLGSSTFWPDTVIAPEDLHAQSSIWNNLNLLGITLSQEIIESARGDPQPFNPVEDFLSHLIFDLSEATSKVKPGLNLLYTILYASLPVRSIRSTLEERRYTKSGIYDLYKQILSIIQEFMKRPIDMDDPEPDVSIDTILDRTGDPFDILAFITQALWGASRNGMLSPNIRRGHRITDYISNQANIFFPDIQVPSTSDDTSTAFNQDLS